MSLDEKKKNIILIIGILNQYIESKKKQIKPLQTRSSKPMKCIKCGVLLPKGSKFCDKCGAQQVIDKKCPNCGTIIEDTFKFCPECGVSFTNEKAAAKKENERKINEARIEGIKQAFSFLRNCGMDLDDGSYCDDVPLIIQASDNSELEIVEALIEAGADIDAQDDDENTALHKACENGNKDIVKLLLDHNAYVDMENDYEETPLSIARSHGNRYIVGLLHKSGAEDNDDDDYKSEVKYMFPKFNSVVPPRPGTPILYICRDCGEKFTAKKKLFSLPVKCPKCGSTKCFSPLQF